MKALMVRMVRDRTILFVLAPLLALGGVAVAATMSDPPTQQRAAEERAEADEDATTTVPSEPAAGSDAAAAVAEGADAQEQGATTYSGGGSEERADALGYEGGATFDPSAEVLGQTVDGTAPSELPTTDPAAPTTAPTATTTPGTPTTPEPTTTTTIPGPDPVVSESPAVALLPITGVVMAGAALGLLGRRRRRRST